MKCNDLFLCKQAYFAKYDAVELYLSKRTYPPGLSYVEKNTFRRFCKKFTIKGLYKPESIIRTGQWLFCTSVRVYKIGSLSLVMLEVKNT